MKQKGELYNKLGILHGGNFVAMSRGNKAIINLESLDDLGKGILKIVEAEKTKNFEKFFMRDGSYAEIPRILHSSCFESL